MRQEATNTFIEGVNMDLSPLTTPNNVLTDCLNGTIITYDGNEFVLQNDMGNYKLENCKLHEGFIPVGIKGYSDILYIVSYNPLTRETEVGSYPSPRRIFSTRDRDQKLIFIPIIPMPTEFTDDGRYLIPDWPDWPNLPGVKGDNNNTGIVLPDGPNNLTNDKRVYQKYTELVKKGDLQIFILSDQVETFKLYPNDEFKLTKDKEDSVFPYQTLQYFILSDDKKLYDLDIPKSYQDGEFHKVFWQIPGWLSAKYRLANLSKFEINIRRLRVDQLVDKDEEFYIPKESIINFQLTISDFLFKQYNGTNTDLKVRLQFAVKDENGIINFVCNKNEEAQYVSNYYLSTRLDQLSYNNIENIYYTNMTIPRDIGPLKRTDSLIIISTPVLQYRNLNDPIPDQYIVYDQFETWNEYLISNLLDNSLINVGNDTFKWYVTPERIVNNVINYGNVALTFNTVTPLNLDNLELSYEIYALSSLLNDNPISVKSKTKLSNFNAIGDNTIDIDFDGPVNSNIETFKQESIYLIVFRFEQDGIVQRQVNKVLITSMTFNHHLNVSGDRGDASFNSIADYNTIPLERWVHNYKNYLSIGGSIDWDNPIIGPNTNTNNYSGTLLNNPNWPTSGESTFFYWFRTGSINVNSIPNIVLSVTHKKKLSVKLTYEVERLMGDLWNFYSKVALYSNGGEYSPTAEDNIQTDTGKFITNLVCNLEPYLTIKAKFDLEAVTYLKSGQKYFFSNAIKLNRSQEIVSVNDPNGYRWMLQSNAYRGGTGDGGILHLISNNWVQAPNPAVNGWYFYSAGINISSSNAFNGVWNYPSQGSYDTRSRQRGGTLTTTNANLGNSRSFWQQFREIPFVYNYLRNSNETVNSRHWGWLVDDAGAGSGGNFGLDPDDFEKDSTIWSLETTFQPVVLLCRDGYSGANTDNMLGNQGNQENWSTASRNDGLVAFKVKNLGSGDQGAERWFTQYENNAPAYNVDLLFESLYQFCLRAYVFHNVESLPGNFIKVGIDESNKKSLFDINPSTLHYKFVNPRFELKGKYYNLLSSNEDLPPSSFVSLITTAESYIAGSFVIKSNTSNFTISNTSLFNTTTFAENIILPGRTVDSRFVPTLVDEQKMEEARIVIRDKQSEISTQSSKFASFNLSVKDIMIDDSEWDSSRDIATQSNFALWLPRARDFAEHLNVTNTTDINTSSLRKTAFVRSGRLKTNRTLVITTSGNDYPSGGSNKRPKVQIAKYSQGVFPLIK